MSVEDLTPRRKVSYDMQRYNSDEEYREKKKEYARNKYRKKTKTFSFRENCLSNLSKLADFGRKRNILIGHKEIELLCFDKPEVGKLLGGYDIVTIYSWIRNGRLPPPVFTGYNETKRGRRVVKVYLEEEARALVKIIGEVQKEFREYGKHNVKAVNAIRDELIAIRENYKMPAGIK